MSSTDALIGNGFIQKYIKYKSFLNDYYEKIKKSVLEITSLVDSKINLS